MTFRAVERRRTPEPFSVRILCTDNHVRSPVAECLINHFGATTKTRAWSARARDGMTTGTLVPETRAALRTLGLPQGAVTRNPTPLPSPDLIIVLDDPGPFHRLPEARPNFAAAFDRESQAHPAARIVSFEVVDPRGRGVDAYRAFWEELTDLASHELGFFLPSPPNLQHAKEPR